MEITLPPRPLKIALRHKKHHQLRRPVPRDPSPLTAPLLEARLPTNPNPQQHQIRLALAEPLGYADVDLERGEAGTADCGSEIG